MSRWTALFSSVIPASGTRQTDKTFIKGLLTIQDQELCKTHNKRKLRQQYRKSLFSGDKTAPLAVSFHHTKSRHIGCFREFPKSARIGNSFLVLLGCPFGRYDLGTTVRWATPFRWGNMWRVTHLSCKPDQIKMRAYIDRRVTTPRSPTSM